MTATEIRLSRLRRLLGALAVVSIAGSVAWGAAWALSPCRPLDRLFGLSGCAAFYTIPDLTDLRRAVAYRPGAPSTLVIAGTSYRPSSGDRLRPASHVVLYDLDTGHETARYGVPPSGVIEQLTLSPDGTKGALTCSRAWTCDFSLGLLPEGARPEGSHRDHVPVSLIDLEGKAPSGREAMSWLRVIPEAEVPPNADGAAVDLRFSADGTTVMAYHDEAAVAAWSVEDGTRVAPPETPAAQDGFDVVAAPDGATRVIADREAGALRVVSGDAEVAEIALDLPEGFIAELHLPLALSPEGERVAALSRRFAGPGRPRAVLQVWLLADGVRSVRHEIETDLEAALAWSPDGRHLLVAEASRMAARAGTELRLYPAGDVEGEAE